MKTKLAITLAALLGVGAGAGGLWLGQNSLKQSEVNTVIYDMSFENLPSTERAKYIKKSELDSYGGYITPKSYQEKYSVNESELDGLDSRQLRQLATDLGGKNRALIADNLDLASKNLELISKFEAQQQQFKLKADELIKINSDAMQRREAEYEVNELKLRDKIKQNEAEVLENARNYDAKIASLQNKFDELERSKEELSIELNSKLERSLKELNSKQAALDEANETISRLQNDLSDAERESSDLKAVIEGADNELKQSNSLFTRELDRINEGFAAQKKALEDTLSKKSNELIDTKEKLAQSENNLKQANSEISNLKLESKKLNDTISNLKEQSSRLGNSLEQTTASLNLSKQEASGLKKELEASTALVKKLKGELEKSAIAYVKLEKENSSLSADLETKRNENRELNETVRLKDESLSTQSAAMQTQNAKMIELSAKNDSLNTNIKELKQSLDQSQTAIKQYRQNYEGALKKLDEQVAANDELKNKLVLDTNLSQIGSSISNTLDSFSAYLRSSDTSIVAKQSEIKQESKPEKKSANILQGNDKAIEEILNRQDALEDENKNLRLMLDAATKMESPKKLVLVGKVICEDITSKNTVTSKCRLKVSEFLAKYNSNYIYEIIPIIDEKSSTLVKTASKGLKDEDAKKLHEYANYGAGRARALIAASLVRDEYGDFARISFSSDIIAKDGARGFEIRAYK